MFAITPIMDLLSLFAISPDLTEFNAPTFCSVVIIINPSISSTCIIVNGASDVPGGKSIIGVIANMTKENKHNEHINYVCASLGTELLGNIPFDKDIEDMSNGSDVAVLNNQKIYELYSNIVEKIIG